MLLKQIKTICLTFEFVGLHMQNLFNIWICFETC